MLPSVHLFSKCLQWPRLGKNKAWSQEFNPSYSLDGRDTWATTCHILGSPLVGNRELRAKVGYQIQAFDMGCGHLNILIAWGQRPDPQVIFFWVILLWEAAHLKNISVMTKTEFGEDRLNIFPCLLSLIQLQSHSLYCSFYVCTSARRTTRLPSGQMTWSTWERTRSHVSSGVRRLVWKEDSTDDRGHKRRRRRKASNKHEKPYHIYFSVGVAHIADDATVFHAIQVLPCYHILIS